MQRFLVAFVVTVFVSGLGSTVSADDTDVTAILDKAMKALGGEAKLSKVKAAAWKAKGRINFGDDGEFDFTSQTTAQGIERFRSELDINFTTKELKKELENERIDTTLKIVTVLDGHNAWFNAGDMIVEPNADLAQMKRRVFVTVIPVMLGSLKGDGFKIALGGEENVGGQPAAVLKVTCPDGKDITISFDKRSGLPVKAVGKVFSFEGQEVLQETTYGVYKDFGGIKVATRLEIKRDGEPDRKQELTEFKVLDKVDPSVFDVRKDAAGLEREARTVPGPETDKLVPATTGYVLFAFGSDHPDDVAVGDIVAVHLPSLKNTIVRPTTPQNQIDMPTIHALSGPDAEGRVAYIEDHYFVVNEKNRRHLMKTIRLDGTKDTELFSRPGNAMWATTPVGHGEIGSDLALSPVGGRVAFLSGLVHVQMPSAALNLGSVEIWDVEQKTGTKTRFKALEGLAWFPDGKRLASVKFIDPKLAAAAAQLTDSFGKTFKDWDKIPAVFIRDVDTETESFLHVGWHPVVSFDGQFVLVSDHENAWKRVDAATGKSIAATWAGLWTPIASPTKDVVLSLCLPTEGAKVRFTEHNSPVVGPKEMLSLKLAKVNANEFQTVVPHIDPRTLVSFGQVRQKREK